MQNDYHGNHEIIILLVSDALRASNLSWYGYEHDTTPFVSGLIRKGDGAVISDFYATTDQTDPSFTTITTGRYPISHGITRHGFEVTPEQVMRLKKRNVKFLSEVLAEHGIKTYAIDWLGRWHRTGFLKYVAPEEELNSWLAKKYPRLFKGVPIRLLRRIPQNWKQYYYMYGFFRKVGFCYDKNGDCAIDVATRILKEHVKNYPSKKLFMLIHLWDTHTPYNDVPYFLVKIYNKSSKCREQVKEMVKRIANKEWRELTLKYHLKGIKCVEQIEPHYNAAISKMDKAVERLFENLSDLGIQDKSLVILTGDHGENLVKDGIYRGHGGLYQRVVKVPLIFMGNIEPFKSGYIDLKGAQHVDLAPTILSQFGVESRKLGFIDGHDMIQAYYTNNSLRDYVFLHSSTAPNRFGIIKNAYKLIYSPSMKDAMDRFGGIWVKKPIELYKIDEDPDETNEISSVNKEIAEKLKKLLKQIIKNLIKKHMFGTRYR